MRSSLLGTVRGTSCEQSVEKSSSLGDYMWTTYIPVTTTSRGRGNASSGSAVKSGSRFGVSGCGAVSGDRGGLRRGRRRRDRLTQRVTAMAVVVGRTPGAAQLPTTGAVVAVPIPAQRRSSPVPAVCASGPAARSSHRGPQWHIKRGAAIRTWSRRERSRNDANAAATTDCADSRCALQRQIAATADPAANCCGPGPVSRWLRLRRAPANGRFCPKSGLWRRELGVSPFRHTDRNFETEGQHTLKGRRVHRPGWRRWTVVGSGLAIAGLSALAACSTPEPTPPSTTSATSEPSSTTTSTPSTSSTATGSATTAASDIPEAARANTPDGAVAFTELLLAAS